MHLPTHPAAHKLRLTTGDGIGGCLHCDSVAVWLGDGDSEYHARSRRLLLTASHPDSLLHVSITQLEDANTVNTENIHRYTI